MVAMKERIHPDGLISAGRWALKFIWDTDKTLTMSVIGLTIVRGAIPAGAAWVARAIINQVTASVKTGSGDPAQLLPWLLLGLVLAVLEATAGQLFGYSTQMLRDKVNLRVTSEILDHASKLDVSFFEDARLQDIMERAQQNTGQHISSFVLGGIATLNQVVEIIGMFTILIVIEPLVAVAFLPVMIPYGFVQWRIAQERFQYEHSRATKRRWTRYFVNMMTNRRSVPEVRIFGLSDHLHGRYRDLLTGFFEDDRRLYLKSLLISVLFVVLSISAYYAVFGRVALQALAGSTTVGDVAIFGAGVARLRGAFERLVGSLTGAIEENLYVTNLTEFLKLEPGVVDGTYRTEDIRGSIEFEQVSFKYQGSKRFALQEIDLRIEAGETVALVGENGAGKTTLTKLIARLYDPTSGWIRLDGRDLREYSLESLRSSIGIVFQDFVKYEATARENIAYGNLGRIEDEAWVRRIAERAKVSELVDSMPQGLDTPLGRLFGEYDLSGGQWQRLAVARAFTREAGILILDEPTSNLDARAESELFQQFRALAAGRTAILVSHRFTTVSMADRIIVLDKGRIVENGSHAGLMRRNGVYARLYRLQVEQFDLQANRMR
jgi:ATP-binding cassette subfamily B protein